MTATQVVLEEIAAAVGPWTSEVTFTHHPRAMKESARWHVRAVWWPGDGPRSEAASAFGPSLDNAIQEVLRQVRGAR